MAGGKSKPGSSRSACPRRKLKFQAKRDSRGFPLQPHQMMVVEKARNSPSRKKGTGVARELSLET